jgi:acyl carrier protein
MEDVIRKVAARVLRVDEASLTPASSPKTITRWDSLKHMELVAAIEEQLGIQFTADEIVGMGSFGELLRIAARKKG